MKHSFILNRRRAGLLAIGVLLILIFTVNRSPSPQRLQAWQKIAPRLQQAEEEGDKAAERHLSRIAEYFAEKRGHTHAFADDALGWKAKWVFIKGKFAGDDGQQQREHLALTFNKHFFSDDDLQELVRGVITAYLSELDGQENALLVAIRADLSEQHLSVLQGAKTFQTDEAFAAEYQKLLAQIAGPFP